ncbi:MAG: efflux RND transporter permease subunit, partial [Akkermansiaceae bacterium]|nr:efflux RND transporter permease subunit [Akkermansiaceae bacterium]
MAEAVEESELDRAPMVRLQFLDAARQRPELAGLFSPFRASVPQIFAEVDRDKALRQGVDISSVYTTLQAFMGGSYVNDFNRFGRLFRVYVQSEADYRRRPEDIGDIWVRSKTTNDMGPAGNARHHHRQADRASPTASTCCARSSSTGCQAAVT